MTTIGDPVPCCDGTEQKVNMALKLVIAHQLESVSTELKAQTDSINKVNRKRIT